MTYLVVTLILLFLCAYYLSNRELFSPSVLFSGSFLILALFAWINVKKWSLNLAGATYLVVAGSVLEFIVVSYITSFICKNVLVSSNQMNTDMNYINEISPYSVQKWNLRIMMVVIIQLIFVVSISKGVMSATGSGSLSQAVGILNTTNMPAYTGMKIQLPWTINWFSRFNFACGIFFGYHFVRNITFYRKFNWLLFTSLVLGLITSLLGGSRGKAVFVIIALLVYYYFFSKQKSGWISTNNIRYFLFALIGLLVVLSIFQWLAILLGRNSQTDPMQYIYIYIGAEIKNLDTFIRNTDFPVKTGIFGAQTFFNQIPTLEKITGTSFAQYQLYLPFHNVNGYGLGNVYTTLYPWLYDFGYLGVVVMTFIMSISTQLVYSVARVVTTRKSSSFSILIYGYLASFVALAFFSNKFFENINTNLIYYCIFWLILSKLFFQSGKVNTLK
ncbi:O-antigen polymerase [Secundilactobacillus muriivasis]